MVQLITSLDFGYILASNKLHKSPPILYNNNKALVPTQNKISVQRRCRRESIKKMHEQIRQEIARQNQRYQARANKHLKFVQFNEGDMVWIHLRKGRFPPGKYAKLKPRADGPFKVLKRIGENAYKIELPLGYEFSDIFNVSDLSPYLGYEGSLDSRTSPLQPGEHDTGAEPSDFDQQQSSQQQLSVLDQLQQKNCIDPENQKLCATYVWKALDV